MAISAMSLSCSVVDGLVTEESYTPLDYQDIAADEWMRKNISAPNGAPVDIDCSSLVGGAITQFCVKNRDGANPVTLTWTDSAANANTQEIPAYGIAVIPDVDATVPPTLEGTGGIVICDVFYAGT